MDSCPGYNLECNLHVLHFFLYGVSPDTISFFLVNGISLFDLLSQLEPKFIGSIKVLSAVPSHHGDDSVSFLQDMMNPPVDSWFILNGMCYGIFSNLDWVQLVKMGSLLQQYGAIFLFATNVPTSCWFSKGFLPFDNYPVVLYTESWTILSVINKCL